MSGIISYVKRIGVWLCIVIACETIMIITMMLNKIPFAEIGYGIFISLFLLLILLAFDAMRYYRHYQKVKELEHTIMLSTDGMPENADLLENEYQKLLRILSDEYTGAQSRAATRQKNMQEYYAMWVHQVKTPIAALRLLLQNKNDEGQMTEELSELFGIEQYVEMVLTYLRMEDMSGDLQFEKVSLDKILKQSVRKYSQMFILQKIRLDYRPVERIVLTDEKWLEFVTEQILSNALKYTKNGGEIRICLEEKRGRECLVIEDNGIGIQAEDLPRVFEKGFTGYNGRADKKSTGIGLYLCKKIMDKMGHKIWIDSEVGKGTRVYLELTRKEWNPE